MSDAATDFVYDALVRFRDCGKSNLKISLGALTNLRAAASRGPAARAEEAAELAAPSIIFVSQSPEGLTAPAQQLLEKVIVAMECSRKDVAIAKGAAALQEQVRLARPKIIITLGEGAFHAVSGEKSSLPDVRGQWHWFEGIPVMPTVDPMQLVQATGLTEKRKLWEDLLHVLDKLKHPVSQKQRQYFLPK